MKLFTKVAVILVIIVIGLWGLYYLFGQQMILDMYEGRSAGVLNRVIASRDTNPAYYYLDLAERTLWKISLGVLAALLAAAVIRLLVRKKLWAAALVNIIILFLFFEGATKWLLYKPQLISRIPDSLHWPLREIYSNKRDLFRYAHNEQYDPEVAYTYKPGSFRHAEEEFDVRYDINSLGLRDDEASLQAPQIVILGDSHAMGFGVKKEETFSKIIEKETGYRVLNAAIASYGTVREMRLLERINTEALKYLIIQYCSNDFYENRRFIQDRFAISTEQERKKDVIEQARRQRYYFGKHAVIFLASLARFAEQMEKNLYLACMPPRLKENTESEDYKVEVFLNSLQNAGQSDLSQTQLIVIAVDPFFDLDPQFIPMLDEKRQDPVYADFIRRMITIDLSGKFQKDHFFVLDDHINKYGHALVAQEILKVIGPKHDGTP